MKNLVLILMAFLASFGVYAQEVDTTVENNEVAVAEYQTNVYWRTVTINYSNLTEPYEIVLDAPPGSILGISGPSNPNIQTWRIQNGLLYITLYERDFDGLIPGETGRIEVPTTVAGYVVYLNVI